MQRIKTIRLSMLKLLLASAITLLSTFVLDFAVQAADQTVSDEAGLQAAIDYAISNYNAVTPYEIQIANNISLNQVLTITGNTNIKFVADSEVAITSAQQVRHITVSGAAAVSLVFDGNIILDGETNAGGANEGEYSGGISFTGSSTNNSFTLERAVIKNCCFDNGGGIYVRSHNTVTITGSTISNNESASSGGGIFVDSGNSGSTIVVNGGSTIADNTAQYSGGGIYADSYSTNKSTISVTDSIITGNKSVGAGGPYGGGGIYGNDYSTITVKNSTISGNIANQGGGIYGGRSCIITTESNSKVTDNTAAVNGGGIYGYWDCTINVMDSTINANKADSDGGGIYAGYDYTSSTVTVTVKNATIGGDDKNDGNTAKNRGGGIYLYSSSSYKSTLYVTDSKIGCNESNGDGGGIFTDRYSTLNVTDTIISGNASGASGGGIYADYGITSNTLTVKNATIGGDDKSNGNTARNRGGGIYLNSSSSYKSTLNITGSKINCNISGLDGGGIYGSDYSTISFIDSTVSHNESDVTINGSGSGSSTGGGIYGGRYSTINGKDSTVDSNKAGTYGGGIYGGNDSTIDVINSMITGNTLTNYSGGGIYGGSNSKINVTDSMVIHNESGSNGSGGGIYSSGFGIINVIDSSVDLNKAGYTGGGFYVGSNGTVNVTDSTVSDNNANRSGGGFYISQSTVTVTGSAVSNNTTAGYGGGIYSGGNSEINITGGQITGNTASENGGGIYLCYENYAKAVLNAKDSAQISNNTAGDQGGGIYTENFADYLNLTANDYQNLTVDETVIFSGNSASASYTPPSIVSGYSNIKYVSTSINDGNGGYIHPINNYDINIYRIIYTVTYDGNENTNGTAPTDSNVYDNGDIVTVLDENDLEKEDHIFTGWNTKADGKGTNYVPEETFAITENMMLYAQWEKIPDPIPTYTATYEFESSDGSILPQEVMALLPTDTNKYEDGAEVIAPAPAQTTIETVDGIWVFIGWDTNKKTIAGDDIIFTGKWAKLQANVNLMVLYMANGGKGGYDDKDISYGSQYIILGLDDTGITREGYTFTGWNTKSDGSGTSYAPGDKFMLTSDVTLYAQWKDTSTNDKTDNETNKETDKETDNKTSITTTSGTSDSASKTSSPKIGDTGNTGLWITLLFVSLTGAMSMLWTSRKRKQCRPKF